MANVNNGKTNDIQCTMKIDVRSYRIDLLKLKARRKMELRRRFGGIFCRVVPRGPVHNHFFTNLRYST